MPGRLGSIKARPRALLLDTNVLLVLIVGRHSEDLLESFKRTRHYSRRDFQLVQSQCQRFEQSRSLWTTPHVLTEVSSFLNQLPGLAEEECRRRMASFVSLADERFLAARELATQPEFVQFGITDAAIAHLSESGLAVFTDDFALGGLLEHRGVTVWNLRKMRSYEPSGVDL